MPGLCNVQRANAAAVPAPDRLRAATKCHHLLQIPATSKLHGGASAQPCGLAGLQQLVFEELNMTGDHMALMLASARRAQAATPPCLER